MATSRPVPSLQFWIMYLGLGAIATALELWKPARKLRYWAFDAVLLDIVAFVFYQVLVTRYAGFIRSQIPVHFTPMRWLLQIPLPVRVVFYYLIGDLSGYWMHRFTHTKYMWRVHHFHHSITQMYWLAGVRATIWQQTLSNLPYILWAPLVYDAPRDVFTGLLFMNILTNHWMHMNFTWGMSKLGRAMEKIFVTPRTHAIHHSAAKEHYDTNFGVVFSMWDHLFGTFVDPDKTAVTEVGAGRMHNPLQAAWLMAGVLGTDEDSFARTTVRKVVKYI